MDDKLTPKQQAFIDVYLGEAKGNATESARLAGYKGNDVTLGQVGAENLKKPQILTAIRNRSQEVLKKNEAKIINTREGFNKNFEFVSKLSDAAEKWLQHPNDADAFTIDPRAEEIDVVYLDYATDPPTRKCERLDVLLARLEANHIVNPTPFVKTTDLREYALKCIDRLDTVLDKFAKLDGEYTREKPNPADAQQQVKDYLAECAKQGIPDEIARAKVTKLWPEAKQQVH